MGLRDVIRGGGGGGPSIRVGDVDSDPPHGKLPAKFPAQGLQVDYMEVDKATVVWDLGLPTAGDSNGGIKV